MAESEHDHTNDAWELSGTTTPTEIVDTLARAFALAVTARSVQVDISDKELFQTSKLFTQSGHLLDRLAQFRFPSDYDWHQPIFDVSQLRTVLEYILRDTNCDQEARQDTRAADIPITNNRDDSAMELFGGSGFNESTLATFEQFVTKNLWPHLITVKKTVTQRKIDSDLQWIALTLFLETLEQYDDNPTSKSIPAQQAVALLLANAEQLESGPANSYNDREYLHAQLLGTAGPGRPSSQEIVWIVQGYVADRLDELDIPVLIPSPDDPSVFLRPGSFAFSPPTSPNASKFAPPEQPKDSRKIVWDLFVEQTFIESTRVHVYDKAGTHIFEGWLKLDDLEPQEGLFYVVNEKYLPSEIEANSNLDPEILRQFCVAAIIDGKLEVNEFDFSLLSNHSGPDTPALTIHCHPQVRSR